ncbi:hypothetical protein [Algoriphagus sp. NG3]|uniref:hypothetical protein n=1 Tax=Algoriphagus sp. NG3 TaxID=3097546 RepID=UPI002A8322D1|nr:hypothetical protein [Algoriphagus sp. NG3]WPR77487.1 hypothetical protein SLW71_09020 [Algoriphagus sp. NG3]
MYQTCQVFLLGAINTGDSKNPEDVNLAGFSGTEFQIPLPPLITAVFQKRTKGKGGVWEVLPLKLRSIC